MAYVLKSACPHCGKPNDAHESPPGYGGGRGPGVGDLAMCIGCGKLAKFDATPAGLGLRKLTAKEQTELATDVRILRLRMAFRAVQAQREREARLRVP